MILALQTKILARAYTKEQLEKIIEKYQEAAKSVHGWQASKEDWEFARKYPEANINLWMERWNCSVEKAYRRLGKMYLTR